MLGPHKPRLAGPADRALARTDSPQRKEVADGSAQTLPLGSHPAADHPLQTDLSLAHTMNVQRGPDGHGAPGAHCGTCHGKANPPDSYGLHQPPGVATDWHLPPPDMKMVFVGRSAKDLCEQIKDPQRNGGKDMTALVQHVSSDPLVLWGWAPGYGRKPVAVPHADFVAAFTRWANAGGPCPTEAPKTAFALDGPK